MCLGAIGDVLSNEQSHIGNMLHGFENSPGKTVAQFALGAEDPLGAKLWSGVTGTNFTPSVGQLGGETNAQFEQSKASGVNTGASQTLGQIANVVAAVWGGSEAAGALGGLAGSGGAGAAAGDAGAGVADAGGAAEGGAASTTASGFGGVGTDGAVAGTGSASGAGGAAASTTPGWVTGLESVGKAVAPAVVSSLLQPKAPKTKAPTAMPDPLAEQQATQQKLLQQLARRGRASTILTSPGSGGGSLGG